MHKGVFLSDDKYGSISCNAASMIVEAMRYSGISLMKDGRPLGRERDWLCGVLASSVDLLIIPWSKSHLNEDRRHETLDLDMGIQLIEP